MRKPLLLFFATAGLGASAWLAYSHYRVFTDVTYHSFCAVSRALNCDTVSQSPYALLLGVPVPVWAMVGYAFFLAVLALTRRDSAHDGLSGLPLLLLAAAFTGYSLVLAWISSFHIKSYCLMCIVLYGVNFSLLLIAYSHVRQSRGLGLSVLIRQDWQLLFGRWRSRLLLGGFGLLTMGLLAFFPAYWSYDFPAPEKSLPQGVTEDGHPYLGATDPILEIIEFADYQCFQCKKMHYLLRRLIDAYPDQIRLVHRHFPMDHEYNPLLQEPFYVGSGAMALMALYAAKHERFWPMNDLLYHVDRSRSSLDVAELLQQAGIPQADSPAVFSSAQRERLWQDIRAGLELGITGTPSYVIEGEVYVGNIPPEILRTVVRIY